MIFIKIDDIRIKLSNDVRNQLTNNDDELFDYAEKIAIGIINDALSANFDIDAELEKNNENRHENLKRWIINLMLYSIYERIPDNQVPERVVKNYNDTFEEIRLIESGKRNTTLTRLIKEDGKMKTVFRWGSNKKRTAYK